jgi:hypothetical protein
MFGVVSFCQSFSPHGLKVSDTFDECGFHGLVVPELQRRGIYKLDYAPGTLREKLFSFGQARLPSSHPAARVRSTTSGGGDPAAS